MTTIQTLLSDVDEKLNHLMNRAEQLMDQGDALTALAALTPGRRWYRPVLDGGEEWVKIKQLLPSARVLVISAGKEWMLDVVELARSYRPR